MGHILLDICQIRNIEKELLSYLSDYCEKENLKIFLSNGTLLGAVKYQGFIPWDDDVDVCLPRADYEKLIELFKDNELYTLYESRRNKSFRYSFAKLSMNGTILDEFQTDNGVNLGVNIDIFPMDYAGSNFTYAKYRAIKARVLTLMLQTSKLVSKDGGGRSSAMNNLIYIASRLFSPEKWIRFIQKNATSFSKSKNSKYCACLTWPAYKQKEVVKSSIFKDAIKVQFEGREYNAPVGYDEYLRSLYGDYEKDPPKEKQVTHHSFKAYLE